ncbi:MAG: hypothetical protein QG639_1066 [Patescibacteria group bacterium]|nr:hypothetical protein [Patescibacteria group bacterium]
MHRTNNSKPFSDLKVALVYDHLTTAYGGAELVLQTLHSIFPSAPIYTSVYDIPTNNWAANYQVVPSFLQKIPVLRKLHQLLAPLHPLAFESFDLKEFDIIISVSNGPSKGVITLPRQLHICYLLSPTRYLALDTQELQNYIQSQPLLALPGMKYIIMPLLRYLKRWDQIAAHRPDVIIAISGLVANRVKTIYNRPVDEVIYPPFQVTQNVPSTDSLPSFLLCLSRLTSYKRIDLAIAAVKQTQDILVIAGSGIELKKLLQLAGSLAYQRNSEESISDAITSAINNNNKIIFLSTVTESEKNILLKNCTALLMPGEEDFGLVGLEAAQYGKPVITYHKSGIAEVLKDGKQAIHTQEKSVEAVVSAIRRISEVKLTSKKISESIQEYEIAWFRELFHKTIYHFWQQHSTIAPVKKKLEYHTK